MELAKERYEKSRKTSVLAFFNSKQPIFTLGGKALTDMEVAKTAYETAQQCEQRTFPFDCDHFKTIVED